MRSLFVALFSLLVVSFGQAPLNAHAEEPRIGHSGHPVPRFVHLKNNETNARIGPGKEYSVRYKYHKKGLPLIVIAETRDNQWRKVKDFSGATAWIHKSQLVSSNRAIIQKEGIALHRKASLDASKRAKLQRGAMVQFSKCRQFDSSTGGTWCEVKVENLKGYVPKAALWGVN